MKEISRFKINLLVKSHTQMASAIFQSKISFSLFSCRLICNGLLHLSLNCKIYLSTYLMKDSTATYSTTFTNIMSWKLRLRLISVDSEVASSRLRNFLGGKFVLAALKLNGDYKLNYTAFYRRQATNQSWWNYFLQRDILHNRIGTCKGGAENGFVISLAGNFNVSIKKGYHSNPLEYWETLYRRTQI